MAHVKVSVSISTDLLRRLDEHARRTSRSRSAIVEDWLRRGARTAADADLVRELQEYYDPADRAARRDDHAIGRAGGAASRRLRVESDSVAAPRRALRRTAPARRT